MSDSIDLKRLKKLADTCRKAGIKTFKAEGIEFTLNDYIPEPKTRSKAKQANTHEQGNFETDSLTEEQLLAWSTPDAAN